jgi:hypothetical protein
MHPTHVADANDFAPQMLLTTRYFHAVALAQLADEVTAVNAFRHFDRRQAARSDGVIGDEQCQAHFAGAVAQQLRNRR